jgi:glycosyltransferase involved in cell wall biosynthesis
MPMRILFPTLAPFPSSDAPAVQVAGMAQAFSGLGHDVLLLSPAPGPLRHDPDLLSVLGEPCGFRHRALSRGVYRGQSYLHAVRIARIARTQDIDLVFSRNLRASVLPARSGVPTVFESHTLSSLTGPQERWALRALERAPGFRGIVAISKALADDLVDHLGIDRERILVAHDAVSVARPPDIRAADRTRRTGETLRVGYTGSLFPGKGAELLLRVAPRCPWATFEIAGGPPEIAERLQEQARSEQLDNVVIHGPLDPNDARRLQAACDVLTAPFGNRVESDSGMDIARWTSPLKLFEYMAAGRPMVVSDLPVLREVLRPDLDALMVTPGDVDALVAALERLRDEPGLGARLAASALERVHAEFTWDLRARNILERFGA